jgi:hypothetical protein
MRLDLSIESDRLIKIIRYEKLMHDRWNHPSGMQHDPP